QHLYNPTGLTSAIQAATTTGYNGSIAPLTISTRWLYTHMSPGTEAEGNYQRMNGNNAAPAGFGFIMKGVGPINNTEQIYDFRGRPNSGTFTIPVAAPVSDFTNPDIPQMTLAGNPYPS